MAEAATGGCTAEHVAHYASLGLWVVSRCVHACVAGWVSGWAIGFGDDDNDDDNADEGHGHAGLGFLVLARSMDMYGKVHVHGTASGMDMQM